MTRQELFVWGPAGLAAGAVAGVVDALGALGGLPPSEALRALSANAGLHALLGAILTPLALLLATWGPRGSARFAEARRRLWPSDDEGLWERCRTAATLWVGAALAVLLWATLAAVYGVLLTRIHSPFFGAAAVTLAALFVGTMALAIFFALRAGLARGLEVVVRRWPRLTPVSHPMVALFSSVMAILGSALGWSRREAETWGALDVRPLVTAVVLVAAFFLVSAGLRRTRARQVVWAIGLSGVVFVSSAVALAVGLAAPSSRHALGERTGLGRLLLRALRAPFDHDGDGFSSAFGGGDCDDASPSAFPGAVEVAGNAIDEDCDGFDLAPAPPTPPPAPPEAEPPARPLNLVLVTVDALRADRLGVHGNKRGLTPRLDAFAREGCTFPRAASPSSKTPTALPAMFAGRYPSELARNAEHFSRYSAENTFVAEILSERGYRTAAFAAHWYFEARFGLSQGFDTWRPFTAPEARMEEVPTARPVVESAQAWLEGVKGDRPWFLWVHVLDPHKNYIEHEGVERFGERPEDRYDHEVRYTDEWLGVLLRTLRERPDWDRTAVLVTADHGEAFGEHGYRFHGTALHQHQIHVPLIIRVPGIPPRVINQRVSLIDLAPTMLDLAHVPMEGTQRIALGHRGESLLARMRGVARPDRPIYAELPKGPFNRQKAALVVGDWKVIHSAEGDFYELFDLDRDPGERRNELRERPREAAEMKEALQRFRANLDVRAPTP